MRHQLTTHLRRTAVAATLLLPGSAMASEIQQGANAANSKANLTGNLSAEFGNIANVLIYLVGALAVLMLIYGGLRYVTSAGNKANIEAAKTTIMYAVVGIIVAILAYAIVNFVIKSLG